MKDNLLRIASDRALRRVEAIIKSKEEDPHKAYLQLWRELESEDDKIARMFNDLKRSNATVKIFEMVRFGILSLQELETFTEETRNRVQNLISANKGVQGTPADAGAPDA